MLPPCLRLADLRDLTDDELHDRIVAQYIVGPLEIWDEESEEYVAAPRYDSSVDVIGTVLVAYESVGDYGMDSCSYFLLERDGELFEVHGSHDSTCGFEGQWEPQVVTPKYLVSRQWRMSAGGYDELERQHKGLIRRWLKHRFKPSEQRRPFVTPAWAIPTWALHVDDKGCAFDLRYVDDDFLRFAVQSATNGLRAYGQRTALRHGLLRSRNWLETMTNGIEQCRVRGILPSVEDLWVAADLAQAKGHIDPVTGIPSPLARSLVDLWVGFGRHTVS